MFTGVIPLEVSGIQRLRFRVTNGSEIPPPPPAIYLGPESAARPWERWSKKNPRPCRCALALALGVRDAVLATGLIGPHSGMKPWMVSLAHEKSQLACYG